MLLQLFDSLRLSFILVISVSRRLFSDSVFTKMLNAAKKYAVMLANLEQRDLLLRTVTRGRGSSHSTLIIATHMW